MTDAPLHGDRLARVFDEADYSTTTKRCRDGYWLVVNTGTHRIEFHIAGPEQELVAIDVQELGL